MPSVHMRERCCESPLAEYQHRQQSEQLARECPYYANAVYISLCSWSASFGIPRLLITGRGFFTVVHL